MTRALPVKLPAGPEKFAGQIRKYKLDKEKRQRKIPPAFFHFIGKTFFGSFRTPTVGSPTGQHLPCIRRRSSLPGEGTVGGVKVVKTYQRFTRAPPPAIIFSTSFLLVIVVSPGVVIASAP